MNITNRSRRVSWFAGSMIVTGLVLYFLGQAQAAGTAIQLNFDGSLGVATAEYIINGIEEAEETGASLVIIKMDTPGGLMEPMRDIIQAILNSKVPVATYVAPEGARAASAGTYILMASHIAAMAPTTELGAATPVGLGGEDVDGPERPSPMEPPADEDTNMEAADGDDAESDAEAADDSASDSAEREPNSAIGRKVLNDAIAYIRSLAEKHGRNADWAEEAVRDAATLTSREALEQNVIDIVAKDVGDLLEQIDGREVEVAGEMQTIDSSGLVVTESEPNWRIKFLNAISKPEVVMLLLAIGVYGLLFEGYNPGAIYPGVAGAICLLIAAYALQILPVNYVGLALIVVDFALIIAETFVPSFGALGIGGVIAFIFGSIMMFDSGVPGFGISKAFVFSFAIIASGLLFWLVSYLVKLQARGAVSGEGSIIGGIGTAMEAFSGEGRVWLEGESWAAQSSVPIEKDQEIRVRAIDGLTLLVEPNKN